MLLRNLKSSLDRFIECETEKRDKEEADLKSSLDRFIGRYNQCALSSKVNLKSSLDRFIELSACLILRVH